MNVKHQILLDDAEVLCELGPGRRNGRPRPESPDLVALFVCGHGIIPDAYGSDRSVIP